MSVYTSSVQSVKEMLIASYTAYNQKKAALYSSLFNDSEHNEGWKAAKKLSLQLALQGEYASNLVEIENRLTAAKDDTELKIARIRFPRATSSLPENRTAGELQINTAQAYLGCEHSRMDLLAAIRNALAIGRTDYAFALNEGAKETVKPEELTGVLSVESEQFLQELDSIGTGFDSNLAVLAGELALLPDIIETIRQFQAFLTNENLTGPFIPLSAVRGMTEAEMIQNLESVNFAVSMGGSSEK